MLETKVTRDKRENLPQHDWSVTGIYYYPILDLYVLSSGKHEKATFAGTCIGVGKTDYVVGEYSENWSKDIFVPVTEDITVEFKSLNARVPNSVLL